jgi:hypothetical protein
MPRGGELYLIMEAKKIREDTTFDRGLGFGRDYTHWKALNNYNLFMDCIPRGELS